jgi:hypothetical protein
MVSIAEALRAAPGKISPMATSKTAISSEIRMKFMRQRKPIMALRNA